MLRVMHLDMSPVTHTADAAHPSRDTWSGSRGVSDPWGRGRGRPAGRRPGSLTPRLLYKPAFPAGIERRPALAGAAGVHAPKVLLRP